MLSLRGLHEQLRPYAEYAMQIAHHFGIEPVVTSVFRSWEEQTRLRARYEQCLREGRFPSPPDCKWPANRPGDSAHNYGLAWDSWVPAEQVADWAYIRRWVGWEVPDHDIIHAQLPGWRQYIQ